MLNLSTVPLKDLLKDYGPVIPATATIIAATVAAFAARAAMRSARASERNVDLSKTSMELGNRAYISIKSTNCVHNVVPGIRPRALVVFTNVGKTPARCCKLGIELQFANAQFGQHPPEAPADEGEFALAPSEEKSFYSFELPALTPEQMVDLYNGALIIYFWGQLVYQDAFGKEHHTTWCSRYNQESPTLLTFHKYGNDMT